METTIEARDISTQHRLRPGHLYWEVLCKCLRKPRSRSGRVQQHGRKVVKPLTLLRLHTPHRQTKVQMVMHHESFLCKLRNAPLPDLLTAVAPDVRSAIDAIVPDTRAVRKAKRGTILKILGC